ncbi:ion transporter [Halarcobacter sp.]|uniref:ion transporter n=1 Tax=Halarcobacter sp. TaxID=2321133 RepID=UPI003A93426B
MKLAQELNVIFENPSKHKYGYSVQVLIYLNILVSIGVMFLETEKSLSEYFELFKTINMINIFLFTIEYLLRVYSKTRKRIKYMLTPLMIIDLIVLIPFYLSFLNIDLGFLRGLRILRIFKLFRLAKFNEFDKMIIDIIKEKKEELFYIVVVLFILLFTLTPLVYYFESKAQPEVYSSMGTTLWWAVITFTTVGYGDMYPITTVGRILTTIVSILGIAFYAIPGSIFTSSLLDKINQRRNKRRRR